MAEPHTPVSSAGHDDEPNFPDEVVASVDETMSDEDALPSEQVENGDDQEQEQDDDATASEGEEDSSKATGSISASSNTAPSRPLPTIKISLNSKKKITSTKSGMRIKLKLPTQANKKPGLPFSPGLPEDQRPNKVFKKAIPISKQATGTGSRRRPVLPSKQVRMPPIASPGLLLPGKPTFASVFLSTMAHAGYSDHQRASQPHRGSSVRRTVGDLFDTDTRLALHRMELMSPELTESTKETNGEKKLLTTSLLERLSGRKRPRASSVRDMVPVSLTIPYPKSYEQEYREYVRKVDEREQAIIEWQEAAEILEDLDSDDKNPVVVPEIPKPPDPPKLSELEEYQSVDLTEGRHPLYIPASKDGTTLTRVAHLDPTCFHITQGRYFGLLSNNVNDPQVTGPNAPGCSGSGGLATATMSTTTSTSGLSGGGMTLILSAGFHCAAAVPAKESMVSSSSSSKPNTTTPSTTAAAPPESTTVVTKTAKPLAETPVHEPIPGASTDNINAVRIFMTDTSWAEQFRVAIWKAAVYACRTQLYDTSFVGPNGQVYPDLGRIFSSYALIKPCPRCKNNKQGVYHCRVRRKHREADFDEGNSVEVLAKYDDAPLESLLESPMTSRKQFEL